MESWRERRSQTARDRTRADGFFRASHFTRKELVSVVPTLPDWAVQVLQVVSVLALAPLISGLIAWAKARIPAASGATGAAAVLRHREAAA